MTRLTRREAGSLLLGFAAATFGSANALQATELHYMYVPHSDAVAGVDPATAAAAVTKYRRSFWLGPVAVDAKLNAIAATHAKRMAAMDRLDHVLPGEGSFPQRLAAGGYDAAAAAENIGAGYHNLDQAMTGWRNSPPHRKNLLNRMVTKIGIAVVRTDAGRYHEYWCMILALPDTSDVAGPAGAAVMEAPQ